MFNENQKLELVSRLQMVLEQNQAGRADMRKQLAELLVDVTREYLKSQYNAGHEPEDTNKTGIHQTKETIRKEDYGR